MVTNFAFVGSVNVKNFVSNVRLGGRGVNIVAVKNCDNDLEKSHKDMVGRINKVCCWLDRPLVSYSGNVNACSDEKFTPKERKGFKWLQYPILEQALKSGMEYLTFSYRDKDKGDYFEYYLIDGALATKKEAEAYFKPKKYYAPKTQIEVGVAKAEEFSKIVRYELEKVLYIGVEKDKAIEVFDKYKE